MTRTARKPREERWMEAMSLIEALEERGLSKNQIGAQMGYQSSGGIYEVTAGRATPSSEKMAKLRALAHVDDTPPRVLQVVKNDDAPRQLTTLDYLSRMRTTLSSLSRMADEAHAGAAPIVKPGLAQMKQRFEALARDLEV